MRSKHVWAVLCALGVTLAVPFSAAAAVEVSGLTYLDGRPVVAEDVPENALFIIFSTWSPKCRGIVPVVNDIHAKWEDQAKVFLVSFQEDSQTVEKFLEDRSVDAEVLLDPEASFSKKHKITYLPSLLALKGGHPAFRGKLPSDTDSVLRPIFE